MYNNIEKRETLLIIQAKQGELLRFIQLDNQVLS